ncbi:hypothetical protein D5125_09375 [Magnetovirga frankeli]|uniref:DNA primase family protein n=1 Tax=Magnetovirga frankeli TaxID=947516 RepID=UPI00129300AB|nr:hypothetical protein D5125_09375 [gamma proteobacterium SS-5]
MSESKSTIDPRSIRIGSIPVKPADPRAVITVVCDPAHSLGKQFKEHADGSISKHAAVSVSLGIAVQHRVETLEELAKLLEQVGNDSHAAIINAGFYGIEIGEEFLLLSGAELEKRTGIPQSNRQAQLGIHSVEYNGKTMKAMVRFKENVTPSCWQYMDRDVDEHTPAPIAALSNEEWVAAIAKVVPGFEQVSYLLAASTSSRVLKDGKPVGAGNGHLWFRVQDPSDIERFRVAFMVQAAANGLTWLKPRYSRTEPGKVIGQSLTTIIDTSVFTPGRLVFVGKPMASDGLVVEPQSVQVHKDTLNAIDTALVELPEPEQVRAITRKAGGEMRIQKGEKGLVCHVQDLTLDTELETQHQGTVTVRALQEQGTLVKVRSQTPFRESNSFAAFYSTNAQGKPFVHDVGTGTTHWLRDEDAEELVLLQAKAVVAKALQAAVDDPGAPFESNAIAALAVIKAQSPADFQRARIKLKKVNAEISVQELDRQLAKQLRRDDVPGTHLGFANGLLKDLTVDGNAPVGYAGQLYVWEPKQGIRVSLSRGALIKRVAELYDGQYLCERHSDYKAVADLALSLAEDDEFFAKAPIGVACSQGFIRIVDGKVTVEPLTVEHRQRFKLDVAPTEMPTPLFDAFLHETFASSIEGEEADQVRLVREVMGGILLGLVAKLQMAILFYDPYGRAGKGTLERIIRRLVHALFITAVSPFHWRSDYHLATLAGSRLNVVGELPEGTPLPSAEFKTVIGGDLLSGRHPTERPFSFVNEAAHLFMTNHFITTKDQSEAFFARWRLVEFPNSRLKSGKPIDPDLAERIIQQELPGIAHWALQGAIRLLQQGKFSPSRVHDRLMAQWRRSSNSLDEFIHESCDIGDDSYTYQRAAFYRDYVAWCSENGRKPFAKGKAYDLLRNNLNYAIRMVELKGIDTLKGIRETPEGQVQKEFAGELEGIEEDDLIGDILF